MRHKSIDTITDPLLLSFKNNFENDLNYYNASY